MLQSQKYPSQLTVEIRIAWKIGPYQRYLVYSPNNAKLAFWSFPELQKAPSPTLIRISSWQLGKHLPGAALPSQKRHTFTCRRLSFSQHKLDTLLPYASPNPLSFYASPNLLSCSQSLQNLQTLPCRQLSFSLALQNRDTLLPYESRKNIRFSQVIFLLPISK